MTLNEEIDLLTSATIHHTQLKHKKISNTFFIVSNLEDMGLGNYPHHITVNGKKFNVKFEIFKELKTKVECTYFPTEESKLDISSCRNYVLIIYRLKKDVSL